jgi:hypothetical protein
MKFQTNDRELVCFLIALNNTKPEASHSNRKRKRRAYEHLQLERIELLAATGAAREKLPPNQWPVEPVEVDLESGTKDYLLEKFGADGEVLGGAFVELTVCKVVDRLRAIEEEKKAEKPEAK